MIALNSLDVIFVFLHDELVTVIKAIFNLFFSTGSSKIFFVISSGEYSKHLTCVKVLINL